MARTGTPNRIESASNITLILSRGSEDGIEYSGGSFDSSDSAGFIEVPISRLDTTKEIDISEIRESSLKANGYSVTSISYSGTMSFMGSRFTKLVPADELPDDVSEDAELTEFLYNEHGVPIPFTININHELNNEPERYLHCLVNSESYEVRTEEETETAFDWVAMDRASDQAE